MPQNFVACDRDQELLLPPSLREWLPAIGELFGQVLALCARAGLVQLGVVAVDGTKIAANATRSYEQIAREILEEAAELDAAEDARYGTARGDVNRPGVCGGRIA